MHTHCDIFQSCHIVIESNKRCDWKETGDENTWSCCSKENPCDEKKGDCDSSAECKNNLQCGIDNCNDMNDATHFDDYADCCFDPTGKKNYISCQLVFKRFFHVCREMKTVIS